MSSSSIDAPELVVRIPADLAVEHHLHQGDVVELQLGSSRSTQLPITAFKSKDRKSTDQTGKNKWEKVAAQIESEGHLNGLSDTAKKYTEEFRSGFSF